MSSLWELMAGISLVSFGALCFHKFLRRCLALWEARKKEIKKQLSLLEKLWEIVGILPLSYEFWGFAMWMSLIMIAAGIALITRALGV